MKRAENPVVSSESSPREPATLLLATGPPLGLTCALEARGAEVCCRITRAGSGRGAVARTLWKDGGRERGSLEGGTDRERRLAIEVAHRLAGSARATVTCSLSLGGPEQAVRVEADEEALLRFTARMAAHLEERRLQAAIEAPGGLVGRILAPNDQLEARVEELLRTPIDALRARHEGAIAAAREAHFGQRVLLFAPLYLASACMNDCSYCGFRKSADVERVKLSREAAVAEARALAASGHRTIDLVTGEIPTDPFVDYVRDVVEAILERTAIRRINLNLGALSEEQFRRLREAGAAGYHLYQETYEPQVYLDVHGRGPKRDMANRVDASVRALRAGFESIGLGVLLGLGPVRGDLARLALHAHELRREFPRAKLGFSLPRIQEAGQRPELLAGTQVDDETFIKAVLFLRLEFPDAHMTVTTRESPELRDSLLGLGITKLSAGVSTAPGGYASAGHRESRQFDIHDQRSPGEVVDRIRAAGLTPVFG